MIRFLPAFPSGADWAAGHMKGLAARCGFVVEMVWRDHRLYKAEITFLCTGICRVLLPTGKRIYGQHDQHINKAADQTGIFAFKAVAGRTSQIQ